MLSEIQGPTYKLITFELGVLLDKRVTAKTTPLQLYPDCGALLEIKRLVKIAFCGTGDFRLIQAIQSKLGVAWDAVGIHDFEFDIALTQLQKSTQIKTNEWVHVVSSSLPQLVSARERGLKTCFVPRPLGLSANEGEAFKPDILVSDLSQLHQGLTAQLGMASYLALDVTVAHAKLIRELLRWLRYDGVTVFNEAGVKEYSVKRSDPLKVTIELHSNEGTPLMSMRERIMRALCETFPPEVAEFKAQHGEICLEQRF